MAGGYDSQLGKPVDEVWRSGSNGATWTKDADSAEGFWSARYKSGAAQIAVRRRLLRCARSRRPRPARW